MCLKILFLRKIIMIVRVDFVRNLWFKYLTRANKMILVEKKIISLNIQIFTLKFLMNSIHTVVLTEAHWVYCTLASFTIYFFVLNTCKYEIDASDIFKVDTQTIDLPKYAKMVCVQYVKLHWIIYRGEWSALGHVFSRSFLIFMWWLFFFNFSNYIMCINSVIIKTNCLSLALKF